MKNVYLYILFLLIGGKSLGQDLQNAIWHFGDNAGVNFFGSPSSFSGSALDSTESVASVSDQSGNLLFYTDGVTVWNSSNLVMANGTMLEGHQANTQGVVIVPNAVDSNKYYIVMIDAYGGNRGLYFAEVDMSLSGGLGAVLSSTKNTPLNDHLGIPIDGYWGSAGYGNNSEKLTSALHANGHDFWIVTQLEGYIYSYLVDSTGISTLPIASASPMPFFDTEEGIGQMKISPDFQRIGIVYHRDLLSYEPSVYGTRVALGSFDNMTGAVTFDPNLITISANYPGTSDLVKFYGLEFSPNSQYVYFTDMKTKIYYTDSTTGPLQSISVTNPHGLQRAIDGKIYVSRPGVSSLGVINNPNNYVSPNYSSSGVSLGSNSAELGLPQWVFAQESFACPTTLVLNSVDNVVSDLDNRQASVSISASNIIDGSSIGIYHAGDTVLLTFGFHSDSGSVFRGYIEGCSGEFEGLMVPPSEYNSLMVEEDVTLFSLAPNPATESVSIRSDKVMTNITITSMQGVVLFNRDVKANHYELNISNYIKGFYVVNVTTDDGQTETQKLIKE